MTMPPQKRLARRIFKSVAALVMFAVLGVAVLLASLWLEHGTQITLPTPTGSFAVGRSIQHWTDDAHTDSLAPVPGTMRELLVWMWYPAASGPPAVGADDYVPVQVRTPARPAGGPLIAGLLRRIFGLLTRDLSKVHAHSLRVPDVSPQHRSYPVVIMRAGASAPVMNYSTLAEDLASHGYVVVAFDAPYRTGQVV